MSVKHIAFTVYPVKDMARARSFYEQDLGLRLGKNFHDDRDPDGNVVGLHQKNPDR